MKKAMKRVALLVAAALLLMLLGGCGLLDKLKPAEETTAQTIPTETEEELLSVDLEGTVNCYKEPDAGSEITATFKDGLSVTYTESEFVDGAEWVNTVHGWIPLSHVEPPIPLREGFITASSLNVRSGPGSDHEKVDKLEKGALVRIGNTTEDGDDTWGQVDGGWISLEYVYFPGDMGTNIGHAVVRTNGARIRSVVSESGATVGTLTAGERVQVLERLDMGSGKYWVYAEGGWISSKEIYMEGMTGSNSSSGYIDDWSTVNVRVAPGTSSKVSATLSNGTYVEILEQLEYQGKTWGFTGKGWIDMDSVEEGYWW